jgi:hypothetical protein
VQPKASKNTILGPYQERLKVTITTAPVDGKANKQLIKLLAKHFAVPQKQIQILLGVNSSYKSILVVEPKQGIDDYPKI